MSRRAEHRKRKSPGQAGPPRQSKPVRSFLDRRWPVALSGLFLLAVAWRLAYLTRLARSPLAGSLRADERSYWDWSTFLLGHGFHGTNPFFQGPLYPYFLAVVRGMGASQVSSVLVLQALLGSISVVLLADAARRLTRPSIGIAIGAILALYEMAVFFDGLILVESLLLFLEALLIWMWARASLQEGRTSIAAFAMMGLVTGLIAEGRATGVLLLIPCTWLAATLNAPLRARAARMGALLGACLVVVLPAVVWNWSVAHEFIPFTYNFGYNLYAGNNAAADGGYVFVGEGNRRTIAPQEHPDGGAEGDGRRYLATLGINLTPSQSSRYWAGKAMDYMMRNPVAALSLVGKRLLMLFNREETPQLEDARLFRREGGPLGLPVIGSFIVLGSLGLLGMLVAGASPMAGALRLYVFAIVVGVAPFFVTDRYRMHLVPALAVLAAYAIAAVLAFKRPSRGMRSARLVVMAAGVIALVCVPLTSDRTLSEWRMHGDLASRWLDQDRADRAVREFEKAIAIERRSHMDTDPDPTWAQSRAILHFNYAAALDKLGRREESLAWLRTAADEDPDNAMYLRTLANAYLTSGSRSASDSILRRLGSMPGADSEVLLSEGWRAAREGRRADAESLFRRVVEMDQRRYGAWGALIRIQVERGEWARAESSLATGSALGMPHAAVLAHEALIKASSGDTSAARRALNAIPGAALETDRMVAAVAASARQILRGGALQTRR